MVILSAVSQVTAQFDPTGIVLQTRILMNMDSLNMDFSDADTVNVDQLDSLVKTKIWGRQELVRDSAAMNVYNFPADSVPVYSDSVYEARLKELGKYTPINLPYNKVIRRYIDLYAMKKRDLTSRILGLAHFYFPLFEEVFDKYDLPLELKYLAVVESALHPTAGSHAGAKGLWQFMYHTGKMYGLQVNSFIDDRYDPLRSTEAAARHLKDLHDIYGNWALAMAAYNSGAGNVNRAIRYANGVKSYWAIWPYLPRETRGYVPAFIGVMYVMNYATEHNIYPSDPGYLFHEVDTVRVTDVLSFDQVAEKYQVPLDDIRFLNPRYKKGIIPANDGKTHYMKLPFDVATKFLADKEEIYAYKTARGIAKEKLLKEIEKANSRRLHIVRSGENLGLIARRYRTSVSRLMAWNNLRSSMIYPGQKLVVYPGNQFSSSGSDQLAKSSNGLHVVRRGETLGLIASRYHVRVSQLKTWNNLRSNLIRVNQKLYVKPPSNTESTTSHQYYTVRAGDTLWEIAQRFPGVSVTDLKRWNNITNTRKIYKGQKLRVTPQNS